MVQLILVGSGTMGREHAFAYKRMPEVRVNAVVGSRASTAELAESLQARVYPTLEQALQSEQSQVVDICAPTPVHAELIRTAASYGKHVICEKPMAGTAEEAREVRDVCERAGVAIHVGHVLRWFPEYAQAKHIVSSGQLGRVGVVRITRKSPYPETPTDWYADDDQSGGVLLDLMIHDLDFALWCFGPVARVYAKRVKSTQGSRFDYALVVLRHTNGVITHVEGSWGSPGPFTAAYEIAGNQGILESDNVAATAVKALWRKQEAVHSGVAVPGTPLRVGPFQRELDHFIHSILTGDPSLVSVDDAIAVLDVVDAARLSAAEGRVVTIGEEAVR